ncbi:hypothetical protein HNR67_004281 [Crossiella cryophila]|uniref:Uncharacterized protein n=1 Tax=Crossiella cryophila TaxID=43355 RepID=A0A7W7CBP0_9PSEU|nr:hypothetical protein [Crossiella cryophila]
MLGAGGRSPERGGRAVMTRRSGEARERCGQAVRTRRDRAKPEQAAGVAFQHSPSGSPIPVSLERTHHIPASGRSTCRRPSHPTATAVACRDVVWYRKADGDGGTVRALLFIFALVFDFPPHPLISARPARTLLIFARVPQQQRPTTQRSRAEKMASPAGRPPEGGGQIKPRDEQVAGRGLCCRGLNQRGSEGSCVLRTAFRKPTTPRGAAPVTLGGVGGGLCCRGRSSGRGQQAPGRTENTREPSSWGFTPLTPNPRPVQQRPTLRTTTANTAYKNGQHAGRLRRSSPDVRERAAHTPRNGQPATRSTFPHPRREDVEGTLNSQFGPGKPGGVTAGGTA